MVSLWESNLVENTLEPQELAGTFDPTSANLCYGGVTASNSSVTPNFRKWMRGTAKALG